MLIFICVVYVATAKKAELIIQGAWRTQSLSLSDAAAATAIVMFIASRQLTAALGPRVHVSLHCWLVLQDDDFSVAVRQTF